MHRITQIVAVIRNDVLREAYNNNMNSNKDNYYSKVILHSFEILYQTVIQYFKIFDLILNNFLPNKLFKSRRHRMRISP